MPEYWPLIVTVAVAAVGAAGAVVGAVLTYRRGTRGDLLTALSSRLATVEAELAEHRAWRAAQEHRYSVLWAYTRSLIDYAYRHRRDDSPAIPDMPADLD